MPHTKKSASLLSSWQFYCFWTDQIADGLNKVYKQQFTGKNYRKEKSVSHQENDFGWQVSNKGTFLDSKLSDQVKRYIVSILLKYKLKYVQHFQKERKIKPEINDRLVSAEGPGETMKTDFVLVFRQRKEIQAFLLKHLFFFLHPLNTLHNNTCFLKYTSLKIYFNFPIHFQKD